MHLSTVQQLPSWLGLLLSKGGGGEIVSIPRVLSTARMRVDGSLEYRQMGRLMQIAISALKAS